MLNSLDSAIEVLRPIVNVIIVLGLGAGGLAPVVYFVFKHLAVKWLDGQFATRLEALKHQHDQEIEELRFKIAALLDRTAKLHKREFETLPEAWIKLNDAFWYTRNTVSPLQSYPDIDKMTPEHQQEFVNTCRLETWEKNELRRVEKKTDYYQNHIKWHDLHEVKIKSRAAHVFLLQNGIFFSEEVRTAFQEIDDMIWDAVTEHELNVEYPNEHRQREKIRILVEKGEALLRAVEAKVRDRIWPKDKVGL